MYIYLENPKIIKELSKLVSNNLVENEIKMTINQLKEKKN